MKRLKGALLRGVMAGFRTGLWITKMMLPITFGVAMLKWMGVIGLLSEWFAPAFEYVGLTSEGVLVFITGALTNLYGAIALIATLGIDYRMATILAVMGLICHNLIVETVIQRKAGASVAYIVLLRVVGAIVAGVLLNQMLPADYSGELIIERQAGSTMALGSIMSEWFFSIVKLLPMMLLLIVSLNCLQQILREYRLIDYLTVPVKPLMRVFGLSGNSSFLWIVMNTLGLTYGGSVLIADCESGEISSHDARLLNTHVALSHSLLEDTLLFAAIGIGAFWLFVPRLVLSVIAVWSEILFCRFRMIISKEKFGALR